MGITTVYRRYLSWLEKRPIETERKKTLLAEWLAIISKKGLWSQVVWTMEEKREFARYWKAIAGKRIPNYWHRMYEAINGEHCMTYLPDNLYATEIEPRLNDEMYTRVLEDKTLLELLFWSDLVEFPETVLISSAKRLLNGKREFVCEEEASRLLQDNSDLVCKPATGSSSGRGILFSGADSGFSGIEQLRKAMGNNDFIVQKRIVQHLSWHMLNPDSVNTVRVMTFALKDGNIETAPLALRMGRSGRNVDNIHAGGLTVGVDDCGYLLEHAYELGYCDRKVRYNRHPDSSVDFKGYYIEGIPRILSAARFLHGRLPHVGVISWDFTVEEDGVPILVEVNLHGQSAWFPQICHAKGLLSDYSVLFE